MATSSSSSFSDVDPSLCKYDVFISFRGGDARHSFAGHLYSVLLRNQIKTFIDEVSLQKGDDISRALPKAIEESAISIIIFSTNYASSTRCLDELLHILKCKREKSQTVLPIFLGVDPSDIRNQRRSYADAFAKHEQRFFNTIDKVQEWRQALKEASGLFGWDSRVKSESHIVDEVVTYVKEKLQHIGSDGGIEDLLQCLKEELLLTNRFLEDAEEKQLTDEDVREWLLNMKEVNYRVDELTDKINCEELRRQLGGASKSSTSFTTFNKSVRDEIAEILHKLVKLNARKDKLGLKQLPQNRVSQRSYGAPLVRESEVYGRKDDKEAILKLLLSDETCADKIPMVLPIVGMGGIGKTTLAQLVYNARRVKNHFQIQVWVTISAEYDVFNITKQIFKRVTSKEFNSNKFSQLQLELSEALEGKKYLFVLDDVWNVDYSLWDSLSPPFKSGKSGSKIIVTTRSSIVASTVSRVEAHYLGGLSDENCWKIFIQRVFENEDLLNANPDLQTIGQGIVQKCKGLPLAVKSVAGLLCSILSPNEWRTILESQIWDLQENAREYVLPALWLSYCHLSPQLKRCFVYCSMFPKDHRFDKEHLILLWMGEGLLEARPGTRMEDVGEEYFKILTSISFFQPSVEFKSSFIMHDIVHDLATFVLGDFGFHLEENNLYNLPSKTRHLSIMREKIHDLEQFDNISNAKRLHTFLLLSFEYLGSHSDECMVLFQKLLMEEGCLRVLSLDKCRISELPDSIGNLKHLRYLDLSSTSIKEIPGVICTLYNLETVLLSNCENLTGLPDSIGNLKHLKYLDLSSTPIKDIPDTIVTLYNLETVLLSNCQNFTRLPDSIGNLKHLRYLDLSSTSIKDIPDTICTLYNLETLLLSNCENLTRVPDSIGNLKHLRYLDLSSTSITDIPGSICTLYILETVLLSNCENLTQLPDSIGNLTHLRYLDLSSTPIKDIPDTICTLYNLETVLLSNCENLTRLPSEIRSLIKLRYLDFAGSPIKELPPQICKLKDLQTLTRFTVCNEHSRIEELGDLQQLHGKFEICGLENVVDVENVAVAKLREKKFLTSLGLYWDGESCDGTLEEREILNLLQPHEDLEALCIYGFAGERFPDWMGDQSFGNIVELQLSECKNCCLLPPLGQLPSLKNLQILGFKSVVTIGWEFYSDGSSTTKPFRSLEVLRFEDMAIWKEFLFTKAQVFPRLKELVFYKCPMLDVWLPDCFPSLTKLLVGHCRQLMPLLIPMTHQRFGFRSLEELEIFACPKQVIFLQGGWPSSLKKIKISRCESLKLLHCIHSKKKKELLHCKDFQHLTSLESLEIIECKELHRLPEELPTYPFELSIVECPFLESGGWENEEDWPN